jgi:DNA-binding transcriptional MerR regulator
VTSSPPDPTWVVFETARQARIEAHVVLEYVERRLIGPPDESWPDAVLEDILRVRRLQSLGVNLQGVEVILHMRRALSRHQAEMARLRAQLRQLERERDAEIARLIRLLAAAGNPSATEE